MVSYVSDIMKNVQDCKYGLQFIFRVIFISYFDKYMGVIGEWDILEK